MCRAVLPMCGRRLADLAARLRASLGLLNARNGAGSQLTQCRAYGQPPGGGPGTAGRCLDWASAAAKPLPAAAHAAPLLRGAGRRAAGAQHAHCRPYSQLPSEYQGLYTGKAAVPKPRPAAPAAELSAAAEAPPGAPEAARPHAPLTAAEQKASAEAGSAGAAAGSPVRACWVSRPECAGFLARRGDWSRRLPWCACGRGLRPPGCHASLQACSVCGSVGRVAQRQAYELWMSVRHQNVAKRLFDYQAGLKLLIAETGRQLRVCGVGAARDLERVVGRGRFRSRRRGG